jgi:hypothetical protein
MLQVQVELEEQVLQIVFQEHQLLMQVEVVEVQMVAEEVELVEQVEEDLE